MSENRAEKSGSAKEAHQKVLSKYDVKLAEEVLKWMAITIEEDFDTDGQMTNFGDQLKNGEKLCK